MNTNQEAPDAAYRALDWAPYFSTWKSVSRSVNGVVENSLNDALDEIVAIAFTEAVGEALSREVLRNGE
jgi:hypothetical protein